MQLRISHKGLILISVPLLFELIFVVVLVSMLRQAEQQASTLEQSKAVVAYTGELNQTLLNAGYVLVIWKGSHSATFVRQYEGLVAKVPGLCDHLSELTKDNARQRQHVDRLKAIASEIMSLTASFRRPSDSAMLMFMNMQTYKAQVERAYESLLQETQALNQEEEQLQIGGSDSEHRARSMVYQIIGAAVVFNVLLSIALAVFLSRSITRRLRVLMDNTQLLAQGNPLKNPVTGQDEIATLDRVFHNMAHALQDTAMRKQEFVSMITHDLRTPLTSMNTVLSTLAEGADDRKDDGDQRRIGIVQRSVDRLIKLVNDLLDMDRLEAGLLPIDVAGMDFKHSLDRSVEAVRYFAQQHGVEIVQNVVDVELEADSRRLEQVLVNLLSNAIKFSPKGATVSVDSQCDGDWLKVTVKDDGRGIPQSKLDTVFDRFSQVEKEDVSIKGGSGLGLAICKALIELHHGTIGAESIEGKGSSFWFRIPVQQSSDPSAGSHPLPGAGAPL